MSSTNQHRPVVIVGAGGHAKTVIHTFQDQQTCISGVLDQKRDDEESILDVVIIGDIPSFIRYIDDVEFIVAIGDNATRMEHYHRIRLKGGRFASALHSSATLASSSRCGQGTLVAQGAMICPNSHVGDNVIINSRALVEHDNHIGDHVHIGPDVSLAGKVTVGEGSFIGLRSVVRDGITIGKWARVGAGSVVVSDVPDGATVVGNPARITSMEQHPSTPRHTKPTIESTANLSTTLEKMDYYGSGYVLVVDAEDKLLGVVTDGTVRRSILKGIRLDLSITAIMSRDFFTLPQEQEHEAVHHFNHMIKFIPIVDPHQKLIKVLHTSDVFSIEPKASDADSRQIRELFKWTRSRDTKIYTQTHLIAQLETLLGHNHFSLWASAQQALEHWIEHGGHGLLSQQAQLWWNGLYTHLPHSSKGETNVFLHQEQTKDDHRNALFLTGQWEHAMTSDKPTLLRCGPKDDLNLEGAALLIHTDQHFRPTNSLHPMQIASAQTDLRRLNVT